MARLDGKEVEVDFDGVAERIDGHFILNTLAEYKKRLVLMQANITGLMRFVTKTFDIQDNPNNPDAPKEE